MSNLFPTFSSLKEVAQTIDIYLDSADFKSVIENTEDPLVAGVTTNPSLMKKAGITDYRAFAKSVLEKVKTKPISFEVFSDSLDEMKKEALEIKTWGSNVYVKIPIQNTQGQSTVALIEDLNREGVNLNVTALFTTKQVMETLKVLTPKAQTLISIFVGRIADTGQDPLPLVQKSSELCKETGSHVKLLWASTREVYNIFQAILYGCKIITVPPDVWKKLKDQWGRSPEELSLDTVKTFRKDSIAAGFKLFS